MASWGLCWWCGIVSEASIRGTTLFAHWQSNHWWWAASSGHCMTAYLLVLPFDPLCLSSSCSLSVPQGPGFIFLFHPALGPLWDVIAQKIRGGSLLPGSELVLEVAEARLLDVKVDGSLLVTADAVMGHLVPAEMQQPQHMPFELPGDSSAAVQDFPVLSAGAGGAQGQAGGWSGATKLAYSSRCGRVHLLNVSVENVGVDWHHPGNVYWRHQVQRHEACRIILHGRAEFEAYDCRIRGDQVRGVTRVVGGWLGGVEGGGEVEQWSVSAEGRRTS